MNRRLIIILIAIISVTAISRGIMVSAQGEEEQEDLYKYYTTIHVQAGDTLWDIAGRYTDGSDVSQKDYIAEIRQVNGLKGDTVYAGQALTVIYYSPEYK